MLHVTRCFLTELQCVSTTSKVLEGFLYQQLDDSPPTQRKQKYHNHVRETT